MQAQGALDVPQNYSVANALKSAYLILLETKTSKSSGEKPVLEYCTPESISTALLDMVVQGLNPAKNQCYFIPYGKKLSMIKSYLGTIAITKRLPEVKDVKGYAVYKGDNLKLGFDFKTGRTTIEEYVPSLDRKATDLVGALAVVIGSDEILHVEYMTMDQVRSAWAQGDMKGNSPAHKNFSDQMAIKTVIKRACKVYANTSDDQSMVSEYLNQNMKLADQEFQEEIEQNAGSKTLELPDNVDLETGEIIEADFSDEQNDKAPF